MQKKNPAPASGQLSRRDFLKVAGMAMSALAFSRLPKTLGNSDPSGHVAPLPKGTYWCYGIPHLNSAGQPVITRTVVVNEVGELPIDMPCQIISNGGTVSFQEDGVKFDGKAYLATNPVQSSYLPRCISLQEQFLKLNFTLDPVIRVPSTYSYFRAQPIGPYFPIIAPTSEYHLCVPGLSLKSFGNSGSFGGPKIQYTIPNGVSESQLFDSTYLQSRLYVNQVTKESGPEVPGAPGVNYWHGIPPTGLISNDSTSAFSENGYNLDTTLPDKFYIGYSPKTGQIATGLLSELYADPASCKEN